MRMCALTSGNDPLDASDQGGAGEPGVSGDSQQFWPTGGDRVLEGEM